MTIVNLRRTAAACLVAALGVALGATAPGCADTAAGPTTRPSSSADRALADPWGYGPQVAPPGKGGKGGPAAAVKQDESPSDRDSLKRDLNNVFNP